MAKQKNGYVADMVDSEDALDGGADESAEGDVQNVMKPKKKKKRKGMAPVNGSGAGAPEKTMSRLDYYTKQKGLKLGC